MSDAERPHFGTVEVATADVTGDGKQLRLNLLDGVLNKHEVGMLIKFLQDKQEGMKSDE